MSKVNILKAEAGVCCAQLMTLCEDWEGPAFARMRQSGSTQHGGATGACGSTGKSDVARHELKGKGLDDVELSDITLGLVPSGR